MNTIKIYGLDNVVKNRLKQEAMKRTGKDSISNLAKSLLLDCLTANRSGSHLSPKETEENSFNEETNKYRLELRLSPKYYHWLKTAAEQQYSSPNAAAVLILKSFIDRHPILSNKEIEALYQSNYQLLRIGRNLNQIARQLNAFEASSITTAEIKKLTQIINAHTETVGNVMLANQKYYET